MINASIQISGELRPKFAASMLAVTAEAAFGTGEVELCRALIEQVMEYVHGRRRFRFIYDDSLDQLVLLLLRLATKRLGLPKR